MQTEKKYEYNGLAIIFPLESRIAQNNFNEFYEYLTTLTTRHIDLMQNNIDAKTQKQLLKHLLNIHKAIEYHYHLQISIGLRETHIRKDISEYDIVLGTLEPIANKALRHKIIKTEPVVVHASRNDAGVYVIQNSFLDVEPGYLLWGDHLLGRTQNEIV